MSHRREVYIIPMPEMLNMLLEDNNLYKNDIFIMAFIEDLVDISRAMLYNITGEVDIDSIYKIFRTTNLVITDNFMHYVVRIVEASCLEILKTLVLHNIHNRLFYIGDVTSKGIALITYDDEMHNPHMK